MDVVDFLFRLFSALGGVVTILNFALARRPKRVKLRLDSGYDSAKKLNECDTIRTDIPTMKRDILKLSLGMTAILLALGDLTLLRYSSQAATALTAGDAAGIAGTLILAYSGFVVIRR